MIGHFVSQGNLKVQKQALAFEKWILQSIVAIWTIDKIIFQVDLAGALLTNLRALINTLEKPILKKFSRNSKNNMHMRHDLQGIVTSLRPKVSIILINSYQIKNLLLPFIKIQLKNDAKVPLINYNRNWHSIIRVN